VHLLL